MRLRQGHDISTDYFLTDVGPGENAKELRIRPAFADISVNPLLFAETRTRKPEIRAITLRGICRF